MEIPISTSLAPEIIRLLADSLSYTAIFCQLFGSTKAADSLARRIRIRGTIAPLSRSTQAHVATSPKVAICASQYDQYIKDAMSRLSRKNGFSLRFAFACENAPLGRLAQFAGELPSSRPAASPRNSQSEDCSVIASCCYSRVARLN